MRIVFVLIAFGIILAFIDTYVSIAFPGHQAMSLGIAFLIFAGLTVFVMLGRIVAGEKIGR
jgi:hypothetical protein